jgi:hypothetical protein
MFRNIFLKLAILIVTSIISNLIIYNYTSNKHQDNSNEMIIIRNNKYLLYHCNHKCTGFADRIRGIILIFSIFYLENYKWVYSHNT